MFCFRLFNAARIFSTLSGLFIFISSVLHDSLPMSWGVGLERVKDTSGILGTQKGPWSN
jgi:hypothetical protein